MSKLRSITGLNYLNTTNVTDMSSMFNDCESLTSLDLSSFNTAKVTTMSEMFYYCESLTSLNLSSFNTANVTTMKSMFNERDNLRTIYVGDGWTTAAVTSSTYMFDVCTSLVGGKGTAYSSSNQKDKTYAHIDGGPSNPGYFSEKGGAFTRGDVNGDGSVTIADVSALIDYLLDNSNIINLAGADCNTDNEITIADVSSLIDMLLGDV